MEEEPTENSRDASARAEVRLIGATDASRAMVAIIVCIVDLVGKCCETCDRVNLLVSSLWSLGDNRLLSRYASYLHLEAQGSGLAYSSGCDRLGLGANETLDRS